MSIIPALILESERGATWKAQWLINLLTSTQDGGALNGEVSIVLLDEKRGAIMSSLPERLNTALGGASSTSVWVRRFLIVLTVLGCMVIVGIVFWFLGILIHPILLLFIGVVIAYLLYPLSRSLGRHMPRALAIVLTYGIVAAVLFLASYFMLLGALSQLNALVHSIEVFFQNYHAGNYPQLSSFLVGLGLTPSVSESSQQKLVASLEALIGQIFPLVGSIFAF